MKKLTLILLYSIVIFSLACSSETVKNEESGTLPLDDYSLPDNQAGEIVGKAIDFAGGWQSWLTKKNFSFLKKMEYLDSTGTPERTVQQFHKYQLYPQFKARITWEEGKDKFMILNNGQEARKYKNGEEMTDEDSKNQAWNSSFGSHYVASMPFKLRDPGVLLTYEGIETLPDQKAAHSVKVEYEKGAGSAGGMHTWWYYFDVENYEMVANYLDYGNGYSFTTYGPSKKVDGILIPEKRYGYRSNADKQFVTMTTIYTNEDMKFNQSLSEDLFNLK